jgi:hypothetical protein
MASMQPIAPDDLRRLKKNRYFTRLDEESGEAVWFFYSREGEVGPYESEDSARLGLLLHIELNRQNAQRETSRG